MVVNPTDRIWDLLMFGVTESDEKVEKEFNSRATVTQNRYQKRKKKGIDSNVPSNISDRIAVKARAGPENWATESEEAFSPPLNNTC